MRLDKYLKTARILKRREAAKELALAGRIAVNGRTAKPSTEVDVGDQIRLQFGNRILTVEVKELARQVSKANAALLFEVISEEKIEHEDH